MHTQATRSVRAVRQADGGDVAPAGRRAAGGKESRSRAAERVRHRTEQGAGALFRDRGDGGHARGRAEAVPSFAAAGGRRARVCRGERAEGRQPRGGAPAGGDQVLPGEQARAEAAGARAADALECADAEEAGEEILSGGGCGADVVVEVVVEVSSAYVQLWAWRRASGSSHGTLLFHGER